MLEMLPNAQQWERGPKITAIGGGTGLSTICLLYTSPSPRDCS